MATGKASPTRAERLQTVPSVEEISRYGMTPTRLAPSADHAPTDQPRSVRTGTDKSSSSTPAGTGGRSCHAGLTSTTCC
jgi:hypothetical protein